MDAALNRGLADLACRIEAARVLREHHLWEAAAALPLTGASGSPGRASSRFAGLMAANALVDSVLLLLDRAEPKRSVRSMRRSGGRWTCVIERAPGNAGDRFTARHADLPAAVLAAFIRSCAPARERSGAVQGRHPTEFSAS
ncbi:hypothetical protein ACSBOB_10100 [Mesorhizobium sp. ASY16-5R]|uniref:hypothetical protein n=1 Tax=Mesorhizobium sp. ASY16-5R TaxID=3445772 RepID=UPI003FA04A84